MKPWIILSLSAFLLLPETGRAMFMQPHSIPLERIAGNTKAYLEKHPDDAEGYYTLGRIYYLGFVNRAAAVPGFNEGNADTQPQVAPDWMAGNFEYMAIRVEAERRALEELKLEQPPRTPDDPEWERYQELIRDISKQLSEEEWTPAPVPKETALSYAVEAKHNFDKAIGMDSDNALYYLGLASLYEQVADFLKTTELESPDFSKVDQSLILDTYWRAFSLSNKEDGNLRFRPVSGLPSLVSYEAGNAWLRLDGADEERTRTVKEHLDKLGKLQMGAITPLVITSPAIAGPHEFVQKDTLVTFDLDGEGHAEAWEWITPETAFLVWDPEDRRDIRSGTQLFGNYTFQVIWRDGFRALSVLDDNMDGMISGAELDGLAIWQDLNSNGISEPAEVRPVQTAGITTLVCEDPESCEGILVRRHGVEYADGSTAQLWDWISYTAY